MNPGLKFLCRLCKKYCKATDKFVTCNDCEKRFHATCTNPSEEQLLKINIGIVETAKQTLVFAMVLSLKVTRLFNVTNVKCGSIINAPWSPKPSTKIYKIRPLRPCKVDLNPPVTLCY